MYTTDNSHDSFYVEMSEEDYLFLRGLERRYGSLSCEDDVEDNTPELLERYRLLMDTYDEHRASGPPGLCVYC